MITYAIIALVSYLLGSIPFGYILVKLFLKRDIRATGSGNIGATNVGRTGHKGLAIATLLLDAGKGATAVFIAGVLSRHFFAQQWDTLGGYVTVYHLQSFHEASAALFAVAGHMFPIWLGFKGGKGVATAAGAFLVISPLALAISFAVFVLVVGLCRYVSVGSIVAAAFFPLSLAMATFPNWRVHPPVTYILAAVIAALMILKHHSNIRRLLAGTENRLGEKANVPPQQMEKQA